MKYIIGKIKDELLADIGKIANTVNELGKVQSEEELAKIMGCGSYGCPSYYGLLDTGCKNHTEAMCKRCWLRALKELYKTDKA